MKITLQIPDVIYEAYTMKEAAFDIPAAAIMQQTLESFSVVDPTAPFVLLDSGHLARLEGLLKGGSLRSAKALIERVEQLSSVELGTIRLDFTPAQLQELKYRAERNGEDPEAFLRRVVKMLEQLIFTGAGAGAQS